MRKIEGSYWLANYLEGFELWKCHKKFIFIFDCLSTCHYLRNLHFGRSHYELYDAQRGRYSSCSERGTI